MTVKVAGRFISPDMRFSAMILCGLGVLAGVVVYGGLSLKMGLAERILGSRITRITQKLHLN